MFWFVPTANSQAELMTDREVQNHLVAGGLDPASVMVCLEDAEQWVTAKSAGINSDIPF
jgi:hypothetical protein